MKKAIALLCLFAVCFLLNAQNTPSSKIKIVLLGTVHFTPSETDVYKNEKLKIEGEQRQKEIQDVVNKLCAFAPNQIFVEYPANSQQKLDTLYNKYLRNQYKLTNDEVDQLGFKSGKVCGLNQLSAIDSYGDFDMDTVLSYASKHNQMKFIDKANDKGMTFVKKIDEKLVSSSIQDFLIFVNSDDALIANADLYNEWIQIGTNNQYVGVKLLSDWYTRNLKIYTNILRKIKKTDKAVILIIGQGHIPILKHLFENNPDFEVVSVKKILTVK